jgi:hypothetical protein
MRQKFGADGHDVLSQKDQDFADGVARREIASTTMVEIAARDRVDMAADSESMTIISISLSFCCRSRATREGIKRDAFKVGMMIDVMSAVSENRPALP